MSDTPLTNGYSVMAQDVDATDYVVPMQFARALERDLRALQARSAGPKEPAALRESCQEALKFLQLGYTVGLGNINDDVVDRLEEQLRAALLPQLETERKP